MKNLFVLIILLSSFSIVRGQAEGKEASFRFGIKGGVNISKVDGKAYKDGFNYNYLVGIFGQIKLSDRFGLQPEINLTQGKAEFTKDATTIYDDLFRSGAQKQSKLTHLQIPLLLNINVGTGSRVKLQVGPQYGNLIKETTDSLKTGGNLFKKAEWSAVGGLWIQLPVINIGARYVMGLTNVNAIDNRESWKNKGFNIFLGITL